MWDILFGSLATLLGAIGTRVFRRFPLAAIGAPIIANTVIIPFVLRYAYGLAETLPFLMFTVFLGELLSCGMLGYSLYRVLLRWRTPLGFDREK